MPRVARRTDRISLRVSPEAKRRLEQAATYSRKSLTDFIADIALERAEAISRERELITLAPEEWRRFEALLLDPPKTVRRLKTALAEHERVVIRR